MMTHQIQKAISQHHHFIFIRSIEPLLGWAPTYIISSSILILLEIDSLPTLPTFKNTCTPV
jgi:hypothetical protein